MVQAAPAGQVVPRDVEERGEDADLGRRVGLRAGRHRREAPRPERLALHFAADPAHQPIRENTVKSRAFRQPQHNRTPDDPDQLNLREHQPDTSDAYSFFAFPQGPTSGAVKQNPIFAFPLKLNFEVLFQGCQHAFHITRLKEPRNRHLLQVFL